MNSPNPPALPEMTCLSVTYPEPDVAVISMDAPGSAANVLNQVLFQELDQCMAVLAEQSELQGVVLTSAKPTIFVAGADLHHIVAHLDWPDAEIVRFCERGRAVMARFSRCPFVSVAAIHGACVGGGLELPLWCDYRVASDDRKTRLGLPEVLLGLVPGWAGTARLPRISGLDVAADLVTSGRLVTAQDALKMKFVDAVVPRERLIEESTQLIRRTRTSESFITDRKSIMGAVPGFDIQDSESNKQLMQTYGSRIVEHPDIFPYAPTVVLEHLIRTAGADIKTAWDSESLAMAQVWGSPASRGLLNNFFLTDHNKKNPGLVDLSIDVPTIEQVGIVGAGVMGTAIAGLFLKRGCRVTVFDADPSASQQLRESLGDVGVAGSYSEFRGLPLVIESVVENLDVKRQVLSQLETALPAETLLMSNTSAIPIETLAETLERPEQFCGLHFCHPELMSLVEVVGGPDSSEATVASAVRLVQQLRKMPVAVNDGPGFVVNRLLSAMLNQALRLFAQGHSLESIDGSLREFGFRGGPFEIIDVIGVDTCTYAGRTLWEAKLSCVSDSPALPRLLKAGRLGRKAGAGFYRYDTPTGEAISDPVTLELIGDLQSTASPPSSTLAESVLAAMALEATRIMEEEIVADHRDLDLCVIHGFGFPKHWGGILFWGDQQGWAEVRQQLYRLSDDEPRLAPNATIKQMADEGRGWYAPA